MARHRVRIALRNLRLAFGEELTDRELRQLAIKSFESVGKMGMETVKLASLSPEELAEIAPVTGIEHLQSSLEAGAGTVLVGAHLGNWEMAATRLNQEGYGVVPLARPSSMQRIAHAIDSIRGGLQYETIPVQDGIRPCLRLLKKNGIVAILPDRYARGQGVDVQFFGHYTNTWYTPVLMARRTGARILLCHTVRQADNSFRVILEKPVPVDPSEPIEEDTQRLFSRLEGRVRQHREQYLWQYNLWPDASI